MKNKNIKELLIRLSVGNPGTTDSKIGVQKLDDWRELITLYPNAYQTDDVAWVVDEKDFFVLDLTDPANPVFLKYSGGGVAPTVYYGRQQDIKDYEDAVALSKPSDKGYSDGDAIICSRNLAIPGGVRNIGAYDLYEVSISGSTEQYVFKANMGMLVGGVDKSVLTKSSAADFDAAWTVMNMQSVCDGGSATTTTITAADFILNSDRRLKENITDYVGNGLDIRFRDYTLKASGMRQVGVIADELEVSHPEFVIKGEDGAPDAVQYVSLMMAKIAELQERIIILESK